MDGNFYCSRKRCTAESIFELHLLLQYKISLFLMLFFTCLQDRMWSFHTSHQKCWNGSRKRRTNHNIISPEFVVLCPRLVRGRMRTKNLNSFFMTDTMIFHFHIYSLICIILFRLSNSDRWSIRLVTWFRRKCQWEEKQMIHCSSC